MSSWDFNDYIGAQGDGLRENCAGRRSPQYSKTPHFARPVNTLRHNNFCYNRALTATATMYFDLNVPVPIPASLASSSNAGNQSKKGKGKAQQQQPSQAASAVVYSPAQITALEARIDLLIHCRSFYFPVTLEHHAYILVRTVGYTVIALTQTVHKKVEPKTFVNTLDALLGSGNERNKGGGQLKTREGIIFLKRLTITLDEDSEKGFGLVRLSSNTSLSWFST